MCVLLISYRIKSPVPFDHSNALPATAGRSAHLPGMANHPITSAQWIGYRVIRMIVLIDAIWYNGWSSCGIYYTYLSISLYVYEWRSKCSGPKAAINVILMGARFLSNWFWRRYLICKGPPGLPININIALKIQTCFGMRNNLFSLLLKLPQLIKIGTDLQFCIFCRVTIAFLIVVIEHQ